MNTIYYSTGKDATGHYLEIITEDEFGNTLGKKRTYCPLLEHVQDQTVFFLQYNDEMEILHEACDYLNYYIEGASLKTRRFKAFVLRRYICFMELSGYDYTDLNSHEVVETVCRFFSGNDFRNADGANVRSSNTINNYISVLRDFATYTRKFRAITERRIDNSAGVGNPFSSLPKRFPSSTKNNPHANDTIRPFISPDEFIVLYDLALAKKDYQALILFHLMYFYGLRIGECLGITEEDFVIRQRNYNPCPTILLRNRLSDKPFQYAKRLFHPKSFNDYNGKTYPHSKVLLTMDFYKKITEFVESTKKKNEEKGTRDKSVADTISKSYENGENHYIFLNKYGAPLSQQTWNLRLKDYFMAANIPIDVDVRRDNLNHRFRHGCAVYYLRFAPEPNRMNTSQLAALLRDKKASLDYYLKMTIEDESSIKQQFQLDLINKIPNLNELE